MSAAIHIELNLICLMILVKIAWQSQTNVNQQMKRVLFRNVIYGLIITISLDTIWMLIDGHLFPGAIMLNKIVNALFLGAGVLMGCVWYLYVLDTLKYRMTRRLQFIVLLPGIIFMLLNILSIWTGWMFTVNEQNVYMRGSWFIVHAIGSVMMLIVSLIHIVILMIVGRPGVPMRVLKRLLGFYIIPVAGTLLTLPYTGMPGTWTCASVSVMLMYIEDQDRAILTDDLTGLNNRKNLSMIFDEYVKQRGPEKQLYLYMLDLDDFKLINDKLGHSTGDQALVEAAHLIRSEVRGVQAVVMRYGGDEFLIMGFFPNDKPALDFKNRIKQAFEDWNRTHDTPYELHTSVGFNAYNDGQSLEEFVSSADEMLYADKRRHKTTIRHAV